MENNFDHGKDIWASTATECYNQIKMLRSANASGETWAQQMLEASSTNTLRFYKINRINKFDMYYGCSSISTKENNLEIGGRYCKHGLDILLNDSALISTEFASCFPSGCNKNDIKNVLKKLKTNFIASQTHNPYEVYMTIICQSTDHGFQNTGEIIAVVILAVFICFLMLSTICDVYIRMIKKDGDIKNIYLRIFREFSLYTNSLRILSTKAPQGNLPVISGLRFISMCWVILQHSYIHYLNHTTINYGDTLPWLQSWGSLHYLISGFAVDTFFALSGFLMSYIFLNQMSNNQKFNPLQYYFHRYIRLTPAVGAILLLTLFIFPRINLGPFWHSYMEDQKNHCSKIWWPMLLYVQNYVESEHLFCQDHLWYLVVDMQLFWISPLILYPLAKKPKIGLVILALCFIVSIIAPAITSAINEYSNDILLGFNKNSLDAAINFLMLPWNRAGPWLMGILLGYILANKKGQIKKTFMILSWIVAILALGFPFFSYRFYQSKIDQEPGDYYMYWEIFYSGFSHHIWGLCVCCIIFICSFGYGGIVNKFLSLPIFLPLGKISYSVYVIHITILNMIFSSTRVEYYFTQFDLVSTFFSMVIWSLIGGFIFCLLFETPFLVLDNIFRGKLTNVPSVQNNIRDVPKSSSAPTEFELECQSRDDVYTGS
ncbi:hypothetical protein PV328_007571 [Microctonus aethiopoides]|nr:hypothetical protein PV328_007571 [Microctonus aethiopoides]